MGHGTKVRAETKITKDQSSKRKKEAAAVLMDRSAQNCDRCGGSEFMYFKRSSMEAAAAVSMDRSAQNCDRSRDSEIMNLRRMKFVFDVAPLQIIDDKELLLIYEEDEVFFHGGGDHGAAAAAAAVGVKMNNINQINLVIHAISHGVIFQYWSLKSDQQQQQQLNSSCYGNKHHRDHHHLRDDDDDEEMTMIACQPLRPPASEDIVLVLNRGGGGGGGGGVYASSAEDDNNDDYIMSQLRDLDILYEIQWITKPGQLEAVKRCIIQRIKESKPAVLLAKPPKTTVRIRLDLSTIMNKYFANPAAAAAAYAQKTFYNLEAAESFAIHYPAAPPPTFYDDYDYKPSRTPLTTALRSSIEALETKILEEEDLIISSSSCSVCLDEFHVGVDEIKKMPCSHVFHWNCLMKWLWERNTCPLCYYPLPTFASRFLEDQLP